MSANIDIISTFKNLNAAMKELHAGEFNIENCENLMAHITNQRR